MAKWTVGNKHRPLPIEIGGRPIHVHKNHITIEERPLEESNLNGMRINQGGGRRWKITRERGEFNLFHENYDGGWHFHENARQLGNLLNAILSHDAWEDAGCPVDFKWKSNWSRGAVWE